MLENKKKNPVLYVHIGYPKAMSTFFQLEIFSMPIFQYIGKPFDDIAFSKIFISTTEKKRMIDYIQSKYKDQKINIISEENILKPFFSFSQEVSLRDRFIFFEELNQIYDLKFIFIKREITDLIYSYFIQSLRKNKIFDYKYSQHRMIKNVKKNSYDYFLNILNPYAVDYHLKLIQPNKNKILVIQMEKIFDNIENFALQFSSFFQIQNSKLIEKQFIKSQFKKVNNTKKTFLIFLKMFFLGISKKEIKKNRDIIKSYLKKNIK